MSEPIRDLLQELRDSIARRTAAKPTAGALASDDERGPDMPVGPPRPLRIAIDADCPCCGYPERFYEPGREVFGCSSLNRNPCGYESTDRNA